jgi:RimJ/RimL family protein N-acetyltransferase
MFIGDRVNLRPMRKEDIGHAVKYQSDEEVTDNYYMGLNLSPTKDMWEKWYGNISEDQEGFSFAIENKDGLYLGSCHTMWLNWKNRTTYFAAYIGNSDYRSKGYGTEALKLFLNYLFNELGLRKVKLNVFCFNKRAIRCYEKCGFKVDGINRKELYRNGEYHDNLAMSITKEAFERGNQQCTKEA